MTSQRKPNFISFFPHGLFVEALLKKRPVKRAFCRGEEGEFVFHLLADTDLAEIHVAEPDHESIVTLQLKLDLLRRFTWNEFAEFFGGKSIHERLEKSERWFADSFSWHRKRRTHARYLRDIESLHRLKKRLSFLTLHGEDYFHSLANYLPKSFDLIYLGRLLDEPALLKHESWTEAIRSRLSENGRLVLLTDQDEDFVADRMRACGFQIDERYNFDPQISALVFSSMLVED
ncbi:MAG: hypothetical protein ABH826_04170 [Patescibacteria group bacterium]|nr:hypothetical protein [Patescibacteria group bacterium]